MSKINLEELNTVQYDVLKEIGNIGEIGRASCRERV